MRAISLKCPNCSANLQSSETARMVSCSYCGTQSRIQHRTRFFERKIELPPTPPTQTRMPIAAQTHGTSWKIAAFSIVPALVMVGGSVALLNSSAMGRFATPNIIRYESSGSPLLEDVNGDGHPDVIGRYGVYNDDIFHYHVTAFDGLSGAKLWMSDAFATSDELPFGKMALHNRVIVQSDGRGTLTGYSSNDGQTQWQVSLGEKLVSLCAIGSASKDAEDGRLALQLNDKTWKTVTLADGSLAQSQAPEICTKIATYGRYGQVNFSLASMERRTAESTVYLAEKIDREEGAEARKKLNTKAREKGIGRSERKALNQAIQDIYTKHRKNSTKRKAQFNRDFPDPTDLIIDGMGVEETIKLEKPGLLLALGHKQPGTRIPMLAYVTIQADNSVNVHWTTELPVTNPLNFDEGGPQFVAINKTQVAALYEAKGDATPRIGLFSRDDGKRVWDAALPVDESPESLEMTDKRVYVSQRGRLDALDIEMGSLVFSIAQPAN